MLSAFLLIFEPISAQNTLHFRYGAEWGGALSICQIEHSNYFVPDGPRVNVKDASYDVKPLGSVALFGGLQTGARCASDLYLKYGFVEAGRALNSLSLRETFYPEGITSSWFDLFVQGGFGWGGTLNSMLDLCGSAGFGYRLRLSSSFYLDTHLVFDAVLDHPEKVIDSYSSKPVSPSAIRRSDCFYTGARISIAICYR